MIRIITIAFSFFNCITYGQNKLVVDSSSVSFQINNAGIMVTGTFTGLEAQLDFDPQKLAASKITASIDAATVQTGIRIRDNHLRRSDFFYVDSFPRITMKSVSFQKKTVGQYTGNFILFLKGKENKILIPFSFNQTGTDYTFKGNFEINRIDYDIGGKSATLGDNVKIYIMVKAKDDGK
jgi:polyisoprenoid-binding protein YceI